MTNQSCWKSESSKRPLGFWRVSLDQSHVRCSRTFHLLSLIGSCDRRRNTKHDETSGLGYPPSENSVWQPQNGSKQSAPSGNSRCRHQLSLVFDSMSLSSCNRVSRSARVSWSDVLVTLHLIRRSRANGKALNCFSKVLEPQPSVPIAP